MQFLCLFIFFLFANVDVDTTRVPENCGSDSRIFTLQPFINKNEHDQSDVSWATDYHGLVFHAQLPYLRDEVEWAVKYKTKSDNEEYFFESFYAGKYSWKNDDDIFDPVFTTILRQTRWGEPVTTGLYIKPGSNIDKMMVKLTVVETTYKPATYYCLIQNIKFQDCSVDRPLVVKSINSKFSSNGYFTCEEGFDLISLNLDNATTCLANTEWKDASNFKCYTAPNDTRIFGNLMIREHEKLEIYCKFTQTSPTAYGLKFSFGGEISELPLNDPFTHNITIEDDGKEIWCQPISSYTETPQFSDKGKSPFRQLRVLFSPKSEPNQANNVTHGCNWTIGHQNTCSFTFLSRPSADNVNLFAVKNGKTTNNLVWVRMKYVSSMSQDLQTITITDIESEELYSQTFQLDVKSSDFPNNNFTIQFDLNVTKRNPTATQQNETPTDLGIGIVFLIAIGIFAAVIIWKKRKKSKSNNEAAEIVKEDQINVIYDSNDFGQDKVNPIYHAHEEETMEDIREGMHAILTDVLPTQTSDETSYGEYDMAGDGTDAVYENYDVNLIKGVTKNYQSINGQPELNGTVNKKKKENLSQDTTQLYTKINKKK